MSLINPSAHSLLRELGVNLDDPDVQAKILDAEHIADVLTDLVARREAAYSVGHVADHMNVDPAYIHDFERLGSNPRLSTLQRYARAIGCRLNIAVIDEADL